MGRDHPAVPVCRAHPFRRFLEATGLFVCALLLFRTIGAEPYGVPTGSMAPTLLGHHKATTCPQCGYRVEVGTGDSAGNAEAGQMAGAACPNCGCTALGLEHLPVCRGDHLLVNRTVYDFRRPRRWEMAVFRGPAQPSRTFVKRVVGLPGEAVQVRDGDVYIDHDLARKTLAELKALRIPVFDMTCPPRDGGWGVRWEAQPRREPALTGGRLSLESRDSSDEYQWLVYRHTEGTSDKARPVSDEYCYNGSDPHRLPVPVHDFLVECDLEVQGGDGWVALTLTDGASEVLAELPVGDLKGGVRLSEGPLGSGSLTLYRTTPNVGLVAGRTYRIEFAFADRRASLAVAGREVLPPLDRPADARRADVVRPVRVGARGVDVVVHNFRLFRDVHYTSEGQHAVKTLLRLGAGQYFVLGDNSPSSLDSRFWSDAEGRALAVTEGSFLGKPFLVHLPTRLGGAEAVGGMPSQKIDWGRIRWVH